MDDLTRIKGIGPATAHNLAFVGLGSFTGLASVSAETAIANGIKPDWIAQAKALAAEAAESSNTQGKPPRPEDDDDGRAEAPAVPADGGLGDPHMNTPRGSSGTAREAPSAGSGMPIDGSGIGAQPGSPDLSDEYNPDEGVKGGGDAPNAGVSTVPPDPLAAMEEGFKATFRREMSEAADRLAFMRAYPLTVAAIREWSERLGEEDAPSIRIAARRDGFRRAGMAHTKAPVDHPADRFTFDELERLLSEPNLVVELV